MALVRHHDSTTQPPNEVVSHLLPTIMEIHEAFECLAGNCIQAPINVPVPPVVEPILDVRVQGMTPTNVDNLSAAR